jgi:hypothetical protein
MADTIFYYLNNTTRTSSATTLTQAIWFNSETFLSAVSIGDNVTAIGDNCFQFVSTMPSIFIPDNVISIGLQSFYFSSIVNVRLSNNITSFGNAFSDCASLQNISMPDNLTNTQLNAFFNCTSLREVSFGKNLQAIGQNTFFNCTNLTRINFLGNAPTLGTNAFLNTNANLRVYRKKNFVTGWTSTFGEKPVVIISDNVVKSGGSGKLTTKKRSLSAYDPDATIYINNVEAADGQALEETTKNAINAFVVGCKSDNIWDAIKSSCILAGARTLNGALVPLKGVAPTNNFFISSDYNRATGLLGDGSSKYLNTNRNNNADPQNNNHQTTYLTSFNPTSAVETVMGFSNASIGYTAIIYVRADGSLRLFNRSSSGTIVVFSSVTYPQFMGTSRSISTSFSRIVNNTLTTQNITTQTLSNFPIFVFASSSTPNGIPSQYSKSRIAFYSIGENLNLSLYKTRIDTLMSAYSALT